MIALAMIAMVLIVSHTMLYRQVSNNKIDGHTINIAGMQRMLSQRIALMAGELVKSKDNQVASKMLRKLSQASERMDANRLELNRINAHRQSHELQELVYGDMGINEQVTSYLALADRLRTQYEQNPDDKSTQAETAQKIANIARNGFLARLDAVVSQHEREHDDRVTRFGTMEIIFLALGLSVLALEAFFIFRPMAHKITNTVAKLEHANNELQEFAYRISHDLRAPVASSIGLSELVKESIEEDDRVTAIDGVERIHKSMNRLDRLIGDVITVTRNRQVEVEPERIDLSSMVDEILQVHSGLPEFKRFQVTTQLETDQPLIAKRLFLKQSLENLISNAIKYVDPDEKNPELIIRATTQGGHYLIKISDNGIGIPTEFRDDIFGMFKRFHPRHAVGTGLGLYLVKQNIKALNGTVEYQARTKGTSFLIRAPLLPQGA